MKLFGVLTLGTYHDLLHFRRFEVRVSADVTNLFVEFLDSGVGSEIFKVPLVRLFSRWRTEMPKSRRQAGISTKADENVRQAARDLYRRNYSTRCVAGNGWEIGARRV